MAHSLWAIIGPELYYQYERLNDDLVMKLLIDDIPIQINWIHWITFPLVLFENLFKSGKNFKILKY